MSSYWLKYRKNIESKSPEVVKEKNGRIMVLSKCDVRHSTKLKFLKNRKLKDN